MALHVVGGVYREESVFPPDDIIYGSGGRAAHALKTLDPNVELTFFRGENKAEAIDFHIRQWCVKAHSENVPEMVNFSYYHGLSTPVIRPTRLPSHPPASVEVHAEHVLQFGTLEGSPVIHAEKAVFDPQNPENPEAFSANGSVAVELAYVLNRGESRKLTGHSNPDRAADALLANKNTSAVIIKCGADGARVYERGDMCRIPAYETQRIWPIGSGDVFAAIFAHFWITEAATALDAARFASRGAALYCDRRNLPISMEDLDGAFVYPELRPERRPEDTTIYLAGPFFTMSQLWLVEEARKALRDAGHNVFSPFHDVGIGEAGDVVPQDIQGIHSANVMLALCDGLDPGTIFEIGYAVKLGIPVVAFGQQTSSESMKMIKGTGCSVYKDFTSAIYHTQWEALK